MNYLGISFFSGGFQYVVYSGTADNYSFVERVKCTNPAPERIREWTEWIYDSLSEIHLRCDIGRAGYKLHYNLMKKNDLLAHGVPVGVLGYFCSKKSIPIEGYTVQKIRGDAFLALPKKTNSLNWVDQNFNDGQKYWNNDAKYATAIAIHRCINS